MFRSKQSDEPKALSIEEIEEDLLTFSHPAPLARNIQRDKSLIKEEILANLDWWQNFEIFCAQQEQLADFQDKKFKLKVEEVRERLQDSRESLRREIDDNLAKINSLKSVE
jgi:hypothetical protein